MNISPKSYLRVDGISLLISLFHEITADALQYSFTGSGRSAILGLQVWSYTEGSKVHSECFPKKSSGPRVFNWFPTRRSMSCWMQGTASHLTCPAEEASNPRSAELVFQ